MAAIEAKLLELVPTLEADLGPTGRAAERMTLEGLDGAEAEIAVLDLVADAQLKRNAWLHASLPSLGARA